MYAPASTPHSLIVLSPGQNCIWPVRVTGLQIAEQRFDGNLTRQSSLSPLGISELP
jgi:hypothetical protein